MTRFKWHTLDKRERDPGWADERPEKDGPVIDPASPFRARRGAGRVVKTFGPSWLISRGSTSTEQPKKSKRSKRAQKRKSGATTPFDIASLSVHRGAQKAKERKKKRLARRAAAQAQGRTLPKTPGEKAAARKKARRRERARRSSAIQAGASPPQPIPGAPHGQASKPEPLSVGIPRMTVQQATISWRPHGRVSTWKVICHDQSGAVVRRTRVSSRQTSVVLGGLRSAKRPLSFLVRGYSSDGQLVCQGSVGGNSSEAPATKEDQID